MPERKPVIGRALIRRLVRDSQSCSSGEADTSFDAVLSLLGVGTLSFHRRNHSN